MASLPPTPTGSELEDLVAAFLQVSGLFTDKNLHNFRGAEALMELDVVATDYSGGEPDPSLYEVKGGDWGYGDIFKVKGWVELLKLPRATFIAAAQPASRDIAVATKMADQLGITLVYCPKKEALEIAEALAPGDGLTSDDKLLLQLWRFSNWAERQTVKVLRDARKADPNAGVVHRALEYLRVANDGVFFIDDVRHRAETLYEQYGKSPKLTREAVAYVAGLDAEAATENQLKPYFDQAFYEGKHPLVQASMYVEHRARLALLKAAVDYVCLSNSGKLAPREVSIGTIRFEDFVFDFLPETFKNGTQYLSSYPTFHLYPVLWQVFLWGWGGFLLTDRLDDERQVLSEQTGVPVDEIDVALSFYDQLFPTSGGWWRDFSPKNQIKIVKMMPAPFRGVGAVQRLWRGDKKKYDQLGLPQFTVNDLGRWQNALAQHLT